jgi:lipopolysaccharide/colanic/teichoic acid biosynthesis glycosyltransferase
MVDKLRLNELPQLFNVLKGDMSLVGPRPFIPGDTLPIGEISYKRYLLRPGLTGLAQINSPRTISHKKKLEYDIIYYDNLSFKNDLKIILKTFKVILK